MTTFSLLTFGCQMNVLDSEQLAAGLSARGFVRSDDPFLSDVVVVNSCSVREKADRKAIQTVKRWARAGKMVVAAGCTVALQGEELQRAGASLLFRPGRYEALVEALVERFPAADAPRRPLPSPDPSGYVKVSEGCSHRCGFCTVPASRGGLRYFPPDEILRNVSGVVNSNAPEITLLGQIVNNYRWKELRFPDILRMVDEAVPQGTRVSYTSPHPVYFSDELIAAHGELPSLLPSVHLPLQSGSDRVLKAMGRGHTTEHYYRVVDALREAAPGISLTTDLIVGYPGETEKDLERTVELVERVGFDGAYMFIYSPRPETRAFGLDAPLRRTAVERHRLLSEVVIGTARERRNRFLGRRMELLVEFTKDGRSYGKNRHHVTCSLQGEYSPGSLVEATAMSLDGLTVVCRAETGAAVG